MKYTTHEDESYYFRVQRAVEDHIDSWEYFRYLEKMPPIKHTRFSGEESIPYESCKIALIVSYGRIFVGSQDQDESLSEITSQRYNKLKKHIISEMPPRIKEMHEELMWRRHKQVAHSAGEAKLQKFYPGKGGMSYCGMGNSIFEEKAMALIDELFRHNGIILGDEYVASVPEHVIENPHAKEMYAKARERRPSL